MVCAMTNVARALIVFTLGIIVAHACPADAYPWVHYFKRPDMPYIHCTFADEEGNVLVATGDWLNTRAGYPPGSWWQEYWSQGIFLINEDSIEPISCPKNLYVNDFAVDAGGRVWAMVRTGQDYFVDPNKRHSGFDRRFASGFQRPRSASSSGSRMVVDGRLGYFVGNAFVDYTGLIDEIPYWATTLTSDAQGRLFLMSGVRSDEYHFYECAISWWDAEEPIEIHTFDFSDILPDAEVVGIPTNLMGQYPVFGPDGLVYIPTVYSLDEESRTCGVLCLNPETEEWQLFCGGENPLLDSKLEYFYVDQMNRRWFCTEDGLVLFDGENWARLTTDNSDLPYDRIKLVVYDEIDEVYYVGSAAEDWWQHPDDYVAFSIFSPTGESMCEPLYMQGGPKLHRGAGGIWYLMPGWDDDLVYVYDHIAIREFRLRDWTNIPEYSAWDHYIAPTATRRTYFANNYCVMIW